MSVADAIRQELDGMNVTEVAPGMAEVAYGLADAFDKATDAPTSQAVVARELSALMTKLRTLAAPDAKGGAVDELKRRRNKRKDSQQRSG